MIKLCLFAAFGGLAINAVNLLELQNIPKERWPDFKSFIYWLPYILWPILGVGLTLAYVGSDTNMSPILALNIGASAPLILKSIAQSVPSSLKNIDPGEGA